MTRSIITIFVIASILLSATMVTQDVFAGNQLQVDVPMGLGQSGNTAIPDWVDQNF